LLLQATATNIKEAAASSDLGAQPTVFIEIIETLLVIKNATLLFIQGVVLRTCRRFALNGNVCFMIAVVHSQALVMAQMQRWLVARAR
jgi:hypothetical protein